VKPWILPFLLLVLGTRCFGSVTITTTFLPNGTVGTAYLAVMKASGGCTPYKWAIVSGSLPAGITAKASSTTTSMNLTGKPTTAATYSFTIKVTGCGGHTSQKSYKVVIRAATSSGVAIMTTSLPNGTVGAAYSAVVKASEGCTPYKWSITSGSLPAGVSARASSTTTSLNLIGTPSTAANYSFTVKVTGCGGGTSQRSYKIVIQTASSGGIGITTTSLPNGTFGTAYSAVVKAAGSCTPYKWAISSGSLPAGITAKASSTTTSLNLTGTPTTAGTYSFTLKVTGCGGSTSQMAFKVIIQAATSGGIAITTTSLPNGTVGTAYSAVVKSSGGCTPYKWAIASGALPAGITAKASSTTTSLSLTGTPTTGATYSFTVKVTACGGATSQMAYKVGVQATANHVVELSWKASTSSNIAGYNVYRSPDGTTWKKINVSLIGSTLYSDSTVANGSMYYYAATAVDIYGHESSKTSAVKVVIP
jgi:large repetitive protein